MPVGVPFEPAHIAFPQLNAFNIARNFITHNFTLPHAPYFVITADYTVHFFRLVHSEFLSAVSLRILTVDIF